MHLRTLVIVGILAPLALSAFSRTDRALAFTFDYSSETTDELTGETVTTECESEDINDSLDRLRDGYTDQLKSRAIEQLKAGLEQYASQIGTCLSSNIQGAGTGISGALTCAQQMGGDMGNQMKEQYLNSIKSDFIAKCTSSEDMRKSMNASNRVLAENGRDGGPAFIEDYQAFMAQSRNRGRKIALNQMANTDYCPWLQAPLQGMFNFSAGDAVPPSNTQRDGGPTYMDEAACSAPNGFSPFDPKWQTAEGLAIMMQPTNNIWGAYLLANGNISSQISDASRQDKNEFISTGGVGALRVQDPETGTSCRVYTADGSTCLEYSTIKQPAAGVQAEVAAQRQSLYDLTTNGKEPIAEVYPQLISSLLDATAPAIEPEYGLGPASRKIADGTIGGTPSPGSPGGPGGGGSSPAPGPTCSYSGTAGCTCAPTDSGTQSLATGATQQSVLAAIQQQLGFSVSQDGNTVLPGQNRVFLDAVCHAGFFAAGNLCRLNGSSTTEILFVGGAYDYVITVLSPEGIILKPGSVVALCSAGTL